MNREQRIAAGIARANDARRERIATYTHPAPIDPEWRTKAACIEVGPYIFEDPELTRDARTICQTCPVRRSCVESSIVEERGKPRSYRSGIRGGLTPSERAGLDRLRKKLEQDAA